MNEHFWMMKRNMTDYIPHCKEKVWLRGSKSYVSRVVYEKNNKYYIYYYGNLIEVKKEWNEYRTIDLY